MENAQYFGRLTKHLNNPEKYSLPNKGNYYLDLLDTTYKGISRDEAFYMMVRDLKKRPLNKCGHEKWFNPLHRRYTEVCKICGRTAHNTEKVIIDGVEFSSKTEARKKLNLSFLELEKILYPEKYTQQATIERLNDNGRLSKEMLQSEILDKRVTINDAHKLLGVSRDDLSDLMKAYGLSTTFKQMPPEAYAFIENEQKFREEFEGSTSTELAQKYNCSETIILNTATFYGIDKTERHQAKIERDIIDFINNLDPKLIVVPRDRDVLGVEIDIFIPEKNLGIEFDGLFFHTDEPPFPTRNKHEEKQKLAYKNKIQLMQFVDIGETMHKLPVVKSMIMKRLGYARKIDSSECVVKSIDNTQALSFFEDNYLGDFYESDTSWGLYYQDQLVQMCGIKNQNLTPLVTLLNVEIIGGFKKLFDHVRSMITGTITSDINLRYESLSEYTTIGFEYVKNEGSDYCYTDMKKLFSRNKFRDEIIPLLENWNTNLSEVQNAWNNGYRRYRDGGHLKVKINDTH